MCGSGGLLASQPHTPSIPRALPPLEDAHPPRSGESGNYQEHVIDGDSQLGVIRPKAPCFLQPQLAGVEFLPESSGALWAPWCGVVVGWLWGREVGPSGGSCRVGAEGWEAASEAGPGPGIVLGTLWR